MPALLLDIEGTLTAAGRLIEGAAQTVAELRRRDLGLRFLTNIESRPPERIAAELSGLGLDIAVEELFTPVSAARDLIAREPGARVMALCAEDLASCLPGVATTGPYTHVLVGDCREILDYPLLDNAFRALRDGAGFLALQTGRYFKREDGDHVDTGAVVAALEYSSGRTAQVLGKPAIGFFTLAAAGLGVPPGDCVVVGDDSGTDIRGGHEAGARTIQVRTGKYADQVRDGSLYPADLTLDSIADLPAALDRALPGAAVTGSR